MKERTFPDQHQVAIHLDDDSSLRVDREDLYLVPFAILVNVDVIRLRTKREELNCFASFLLLSWKQTEHFIGLIKEKGRLSLFVIESLRRSFV